MMCSQGLRDNIIVCVHKHPQHTHTWTHKQPAPTELDALTTESSSNPKPAVLAFGVAGINRSFPSSRHVGEFLFEKTKMKLQGSV